MREEGSVTTNTLKEAETTKKSEYDLNAKIINQ